MLGSYHFGCVEAVHVSARCTQTAHGPSRSSLIRVVDESQPLPPLCISPKERRVQWELMQQNFGCRWEGETGWFTPSHDDAQELVSASSEPLAAVYQLQFPRDEPEVGAWRGWGVIKPGDERTVPLSEATVIERQREQGSSTFQFPGAGGRCSLRLGQVWAVAAVVVFVVGTWSMVSAWSYFIALPGLGRGGELLPRRASLRRRRVPDAARGQISGGRVSRGQISRGQISRGRRGGAARTTSQCQSRRGWVRRPVRAARLSEEPGGCSGARIGSAARVGPTTSLVGRVDAAAAAAAAPAAAPAAAASEAGGSGGLATHTQHPSASFMAMSFRKVPPTPNPHP